MTDIQKALADLKARQEAGEQMPCPRCGKDTMKPALCTNALSRVADGIFVCDDCGTQEALLAFMRNPMPVDEWAFLNPELPSVDFKDLPGKAVWEQIRMEHGPALIRRACFARELSVRRRLSLWRVRLRSSADSILWCVQIKKAQRISTTTWKISSVSANRTTPKR